MSNQTQQHEQQAGQAFSQDEFSALLNKEFRPKTDQARSAVESAVKTLAQQALFQSGWFVVGLLTQTLIVHMIRTPKIPFLQSRAAMPLMVMTAVIMAVGIFLPMGPLAHYFKLQALPSLYFVFLPVILLAYMGLTQAVKGFYIRRFGWQ